MNKITKLLKGKDMVLIIGQIGSGKTTMAKQIQGDTKILEDINYVRSGDQIKENYIANEIITARHNNKKIILVINGIVDSRFKPSYSTSWIFLGINDAQFRYYSKFISKLALSDIMKQTLVSISNHRKTRPYLLVNHDAKNNVLEYEFGRFKPNEENNIQEQVYICDSKNLFCKFELSNRYPTGVCVNCGKVK